MGAQKAEGHLETDYVARGATESEALRSAGERSLQDVKRLLDALIARDAIEPSSRRWFDARRDEGKS